MFTALQDGWVVAYNDETLEELWRFNVGTPLKGAPVTYAIGPKQYLAVQAGGRHLHPVKFDKLRELELSVRVRVELSYLAGSSGPAPRLGRSRGPHAPLRSLAGAPCAPGVL